MRLSHLRLVKLLYYPDDEKVALPAGEYNLQDGKILVVAEEGKSQIEEAMEVEKMEDDEDEKKRRMAEEEIIVDAPEEKSKRLLKWLRL